MEATSTSRKSSLCLGILLKPHGLLGAMKLKSFTSPAKRIADYSPLFDLEGPQTFEIESLCGDQGEGRLIVRLKHISTRDQAEKLRGVKLCIDRTHFPEIQDKDSFYYADLEGVHVIDQATRDQIGVIHHVNNHGGGDFLEILGLDGSLATLPFTKQAVPHVDIVKGQVLCDRAYLLGSSPQISRKKKAERST